MRSEPAAQVGSHLILPGSHLGEMKIFYMNTRKWASPARWHSIFFNQFCFTFQILINFLKQSFSSDITNILIKLRQKIPCEREIKIISPRRASPHNWASSPPYEQFLKRFINLFKGATKSYRKIIFVSAKKQA